MSLPNVGIFECYRGDGFVRSLVIKEAGVVKNITGWTLRFVAKASLDDADADAVIDTPLVLTDPTHGVAVLSLTVDDTTLDAATYPFTVRIIQTGGEPPRSIAGFLVVAQSAVREGV